MEHTETQKTFRNMAKIIVEKNEAQNESSWAFVQANMIAILADRVTDLIDVLKEKK